MQHQVQRYVAGDLLGPATTVSVKPQHVRRVGVHWHDFYELGYISNGTAAHIINGERHRLSPGSVFLLTPADLHEIRADSHEPLSSYNVVIDAWYWELRLAALFSSGPEHLPWAIPGLFALEPDFRRLWHEGCADRPEVVPMMQAVLDCIVVELGRQRAFDQAGGHGFGSSDIKRAVLYVDRHFRFPLTLADVAAQAHLSPNYFSGRFRAFTGTSFQRYLQQRRLRFARSLLASTDLGVSEICHASGFTSLSHFGRAYRNQYGASPTESRGASTPPGSARLAPTQPRTATASEPQPDTASARSGSSAGRASSI